MPSDAIDTTPSKMKFHTIFFILNWLNWPEMAENPSFWPFKILILTQKMPYLAQDYKSGPFYVKNFFVSDSTQILCLESLGHKDFKF